MCQIVWMSFRQEESLNIVEQLVQEIKLLPKKIKQFFKSRTIDAEHIIGYCYLMLYLLPFLVNGMLFIVLGVILNEIPFLSFLPPIIICFVNGIFLFYFTKRIVAYIKQKRFLLSLILIYIVLSFLRAFIFWIGTIFLNITVMFAMINPNSLSKNELFDLISKYSYGYQTMINSFEGYLRVVVPFIQILGFSYFLNLFVPPKYQNIDIPINKKIIRIFIKVIYLILPIVFFLIFSIVDKDSYTVIAGIGLLIIWFSKPKNIISLLDRSIIISDEDVKPEVINRIKILQLFLTLIEISWGISVYFFANYSAAERLYITLVILFIGLIILIIWQKYIKAHQTQWLENTLKKESAQKILDHIQTDKTEGEKQQ